MPHPIWVCIVGFCFFLTLNGNPLVSKSADPYQLIQEWEEKKPNTSKCEQCLAGFELLDLLLKLPPAEDLIVELAVKICLRLELTNVDEIVCRGAVIEFKVEAFQRISIK